MYLEGNIETKVFSDPASGVVRHIREIAIRGDGKFLHFSHFFRVINSKLIYVKFTNTAYSI
jgi:hypothetical protein